MTNKIKRMRSVVKLISTLNMIFSVTHYLELRNVISIHCVFSFHSKGRSWIGCVDIIEH